MTEPLGDPLEAESWRNHAECLYVYPDVFYPHKYDHSSCREAKSICARCPVKTECLTAAFEIDEPFGIWGGLTPRERDAMRRADNRPRRRPPEIFPHGTAAGYARHKRAGEQPCRACVTAHTRDRREWKHIRPYCNDCGMPHGLGECGR